MSSSQHLSNSILDTRLQSSSCQDLSNNNLHSSSSFLSHNNNNHILAADAHERERLKAMLPTYRPAPDYETAVQLKYRTPSNELYNLNQLQYQAAALAAHNTAAAYYAGSQPDVHQTGDGVLMGHMATHRYPDVAQPAQAMHAQYNMAAAAASASAPQNNVYVDLSQRLQMIRNKPPPPYPVNRLSSSSTPDLAVASHRPLLGYRAYVSGSSPDLVSNRNLLNSQYPYNGHPSGLVNPGQVTTSSGATMLHQYPYMAHMGHSQSYLPPHGTFENLNMIEEQPSIMSQLRQSALNQPTANHVPTNTQSYEQNSPTLPPSGYRGSGNMQTTQPAALQRNAINGSIEPIYENVPLPQYTSSTSVTPQRSTEQRSSGSSTHNNEIRNRTSSIQSAPGVMPNQPPIPAVRHHHLPQREPTMSPAQKITQPQSHSYLKAHDEPDEISMNIKKFNHQTQPDRAASIDAHLMEPTPPQRAIRAVSAAPAIGPTSTQEQMAIKMTPPPRQHKNMKNASSVSAVDVIQVTSSMPPSASMSNTTMHSPRIASSASHDESLSHHFSAMNLSTTSSSMYNTTLDTTTQSSSTAGNTSSKEKRKKRWNFLGRSKTPDKQKSATLGREKAVNSTKLQKIKLAQDDLNLHHRWSTGVPRLQPISGQYSKDKLVICIFGAFLISLFKRCLVFTVPNTYG